MTYESGINGLFLCSGVKEKMHRITPDYTGHNKIIEILIDDCPSDTPH